MMRKIKLVLLIMVVVFLAVVVFQNQSFLLNHKDGLYINLWFKEITIGDTPMFIYFIVSFVTGFMCATYNTVLKHFYAKRQAKQYEEIIQGLKDEMQTKNSQETKEPDVDNNEIIEINAEKSA